MNIYANRDMVVLNKALVCIHTCYPASQPAIRNLNYLETHHMLIAVPVWDSEANIARPV
jgi:hypothetical protein